VSEYGWNMVGIWSDSVPAESGQKKKREFSAYLAGTLLGNF